MMMSGVTTLVSASYMACTGPALVWTRHGGGANIVVLTDDQIAVGVLPPAQLKTAKQRLDDGEALINVVGPKASYIHISAVQTVTADLNGTTVLVKHVKHGGIQKADQLRFTDRDTQAEFMIEARNRLPQTAEIYKTQKNRWLHAAKPFNLLILLLLAAAGVHTVFELELTDRYKTREKLNAWAGESDPAPQTIEDRAIRTASTRATTRTLAHNPALMRILVFGAIALGIIGLILGSIGYTASMTICAGACGLSFFWMMKRLCNPPRCIHLVMPGAR